MQDSVRRCLLFAIAAAVAAAGCGGEFKVGRPWDAAAEASVFDDGIDLVDDPAKLSDQWAFRARDDMRARASLADLVAVVTVSSVQTAKDVDGAEVRRIDARIDDILYGRAPDKTLALLSPASSLGHALIVRHEGRITGSFVVFLRWFDLPDGATGHHFHLSPSSPAVITTVREVVAARVQQEAAAE